MSERITGHTRLISLLATPIRHSMSPTMHNEAFVKLGLDYVYMVFEVGNEELADAIQAIRALGIVGSNISMPNKQKVMPLLDEITEEARLMGSVNTVVNKDGHLIGYCTDGVGAVQALKAEGVDVKGKVITMTGIGGAGTAIGIQSAIDGAKELRIFNLKDSHFADGEETVKKINDATDCQASITDLDDQVAFKQSLAESDIYIDATSVGMKPLEGQSLVTDPEDFREDLVVMDVCYSPAETELLRLARQNGVKKAFNGIGMMLYQGAVAFKLFTGEEMPVDYIRGILFGDE